MNRRAFSLIEVLIAIVVLSIGLLGLAISMPATISIQRRGAEATRGVTAALAAKTYLQSRPDLVRLHTWDARIATPNPLRDAVGFGKLVENQQWSAGSKRFAWDNTNAGQIAKSGPYVGRMDFSNAVMPNVFIPVGDRLWPDPSIGQRAEFVWDFIARRLPARSASQVVSPQIQIAVFVRSIDPGIRVREGLTLYQSITNLPTPVPLSSRRVPVAVLDNTTNVLPTFDGRGEYARPFTLDVTYDSRSPDRISIRGTPTTSHLNVALRPGQKLVDNLGNVYRVMRVDTQDPDTIIISPSVPDWVRSTARSNPDSMFQIAMTPQTPVTIEVFEITLTDPLSSPNGSGVRGMPKVTP
jgi:prepilin-type N-terminal cleavage/methylation domain-containing protein